MSIEAVTARISEIGAQFGSLTGPAAPVGAVPAVAFADVLSGVLAAGKATPAATVNGATVGDRLLAAARGEVGQTESPPGSNDSARIRTYRTATVGSSVGPWCAYFASWAARQAGAPLGDQGQGFGAVDDVWGWAKSRGKAVPVGQAPRPGDLVIMNEHMGIVESVQPDGRIATIEGNESNAVTRAVRRPSEIVGFVRLG